MLAVVEIGKKQYIVKKGDTVDVQRLKVEGDKIIFDKVLILADDKKIKIGTPYLDKAKVDSVDLLEESGYLQSTFSRHEIRVDPVANTARLELIVETGPQAVRSLASSAV